MGKRKCLLSSRQEIRKALTVIVTHVEGLESLGVVRACLEIIYLLLILVFVLLVAAGGGLVMHGPSLLQRRWTLHNTRHTYSLAQAVFYTKVWIHSCYIFNG